MKADLTTYGSHLQSQSKASSLQSKDVPKAAAPIADPKLAENKIASGPDYKVELSRPALTPAVPAAEVATPKVPESKEPKKLEVKKPPEVSIDTVKEGSLKKPAIIFIKGLDIFSSPSNSEGSYAGVGKMAEAVEGSRIYGWDQSKEIIKEIKKVQVDRPVILVGHSFGGDTAVEIAEELNSLEHQFRKVDLLVTLDAVGFNNDIIPQNVKNHLNIFGENNFFLNDGPHVARRHEVTNVKNILTHLDHTDMDDAKEIQFEVVSLIQETLGKKA